MSRFRQLLCTTVIVAVATLGTATIANAQTTPSNPGQSAQQHQTRCDKAKVRLAKLEDRRVRSEQVLDRLHKAIDAGTSHPRLRTRLDRVQVRHDQIVDRINKIHARCG